MPRPTPARLATEGVPPGRRLPDPVRTAVAQQGVTWPDRLRWASAAAADTRAADTTDDGLHRWAAEVDPDGGGLFARRLELAGLTPAAARAAIATIEPPVAPEPDWWPWFSMVVDAYAPGDDDPAVDDTEWLARVSDTLPPGADRSVPFAHLLWPVCRAAWTHLRDRAPRGLPALTATAEMHLRTALLARLSAVAAPALTELLWQSVPYGQRLLARVQPEPEAPARARYAALCRSASAHRLAEVLSEFPVLGSLLATVVRQWTQATEELLRRLDDDRPALRDALGVPVDARVEDVTAAAGDTHNDGRSVCVLTVGGRRVVYKPRDVRLEDFFARVADAMREAAPQAAISAARVLPRRDDAGDYGYAEFVAHRPCTDAESLRAFYRDAGRLLAVLDLLAATDCHHENLIADGARLVLVDAETLLDALGPGPVGDEPGSDLAALTTATGTLLRTGMLPSWLWLAGRRRAVDISAIGAHAAGAPQRGQGWLAINTDAMTQGQVAVEPRHPTSLPTPPGEAPDLTRAVDDLVAGHRSAAQALARIGPEVLSPLLDDLADHRRRVVIRPTYVYAALLAQSVEPDALRSRTARGMVLERLARAHLGGESQVSGRLLAAEQDAMARLDVPYFEAPVAGGRTMWPGGVADGWPDADGVAEVRARLARSSDDTSAAGDLIRASVAASRFRMGPVEPGPPVVPAAQAPDGWPASARWIAAVRQPAGEGGAWIAPTLLPDGVHATLQPIAPGLYDGRVGLAAALAEWGHRAGGTEQGAQAATAAAAAVEPVLGVLEGDPSGVARLVSATGPGMYGVGGVLRGLSLLQSRGDGDSERYAAAARTLAGALTVRHLDEDRVLDRLLGTSGLVTPLIELRAQQPDEHVDALLRHAATRLVRAQDADTGGWSTIPAGAPLTGLAHGASGIALALAEAAVALEDEQFLAAAIRGLAYERTVFDHDAGNWPDFRSQPAGPGFMLGWCAGAPGIGLVRARLLALLPDHDDAGDWREDLHIAAATTAAARLSSRDHLCCGATGVVAVLRVLAATTGTRDWAAAADGAAAAVLARVDGGLPVSILGPGTGALAMPGLMTGATGAALAVLPGDPSGWVVPLLL